jgi:hypothetical protein
MIHGSYNVKTINSLVSSSGGTHLQARTQSITTFHVISLKQNIQLNQSAAWLTAGWYKKQNSCQSKKKQTQLTFNIAHITNIM